MNDHVPQAEQADATDGTVPHRVDGQAGYVCFGHDPGCPSFRDSVVFVADGGDQIHAVDGPVYDPDAVAEHEAMTNEESGNWVLDVAILAVVTGTLAWAFVTGFWGLV